MIDLKVPSPGESISEVEIGSWLVEDGAFVDKDQEVVSLESEKASLIVNAPQAGEIKILIGNGTRVAVGAVIAQIDPSAAPVAVKTSAEPSVSNGEKVQPEPKESSDLQSVKITPVAKDIMQEHQLSVEDIIKGLKRITREHVLQVINAGPADTGTETSQPKEIRTGRIQDRKQMSLLRKKLGERLVAVKNETAMLTTFNEIDMSAVIDLRSRYKSAFEEKHKVKLGFMSFFTLACTRAIKAFPGVNTQIDGEDIISFNYVDIGIAVQTPKGLMVPILRNTDRMSLAEIETGIARMAVKARENRISLEDLQGGTFSITNGGVFGSLLSTPILNPPQPAILGMHNIVDRPVAMAGQVVIRPMMYVALSYDHRLIDGKDSVGFLKAVKEMIENPLKLLDPSGEAEKTLLGI